MVEHLKELLGIFQDDRNFLIQNMELCFNIDIYLEIIN